MLDSLSSTETQIDGAYAGVAVCKHKDRHVIHVEMEETGAKRDDWTSGGHGDKVNLGIDWTCEQELEQLCNLKRHNPTCPET
ncbi:hypothetical protein CgunFtcFv8_006860 [Champsocephalus gunnari]|uniref:Uncharacterized protein n=1 Tax=Champsocephalus gunnari TaxID=52237 RepID=A0AAN8CGC8_CHAGU|nr:hypothetical protein CgunFtcFv8_006860 [Champsocephalus gunnari]